MNVSSEPIDEDEQNDIISSLNSDCRNHAKQLRFVLRAACYGSAMVTLVAPVLFGVDIMMFENNFMNNKLVRSYPILSSAMHVLAAVMSNDLVSGEEECKGNDFTYIKVMLGLLGLAGTSSLLITFILHGYFEPHIWSMSILNIVTLTSSVYFVYDTKHTLSSIEDLKTSRYKYKTL
mmetsp:Transcript_18580/g.21452  ORF Transcript_18580/g.21452 Transcript_18580/m.21452 type:complete len:177 (-) Transcript_18580:15-545(-)